MIQQREVLYYSIAINVAELEMAKKKVQQETYLEMKKQQKELDDKYEQLIKQQQIVIAVALLNK
jgi:hypothetical protein